MPRPLPNRCRGFSLVEVIIAIGVVSLGLLSVVALLSSASQGAREATSYWIGQQIAARAVGDLQLMPWHEIATNDGRITIHDREGRALPSGHPVEPAEFTSRISVFADGSHAYDVVVHVASLPGPLGAEAIDRLRSGHGHHPQVRTYPTRLARLEK